MKNKKAKTNKERFDAFREGKSRIIFWIPTEKQKRLTDYAEACGVPVSVLCRNMVDYLLSLTK